MQTNDGSTPTARFAARVAEAARRAGYDLAPRAGGRARLARDSGLSETTITRMLSGERLPDPRFITPLAKVIGLNPLVLVVEAGILPAETLQSLSETRSPQVRSQPITPEEAADQLGLENPHGREMLRGVIEQLRKLESTESTQSPDETGQTGGIAAER